jgi:hypothetical protein
VKKYFLSAFWLAPALLVHILAGPLQASTIIIPNGSFESPVVSFVDIQIDHWQKSPKPDWYNEGGGISWDQLSGTFKNQPPGTPSHLDNCDGEQAIWVFAVPQAGIFQDYNSTDGSNSVPSHAFNAKFQAGNSYTLTVGVNGGGGGMSNGTTLEISLYYRDGASNQVIVAATLITNTLDTFPNHTHFVDFEAKLEVVKRRDPWAGQNMGVQILSTVNSNMQAGYWDVDNVRLSALREPELTGVVSTNGQFNFNLESEPGLRFEILGSKDLALPVGQWTSLGILRNVSGRTPFTSSTAGFDLRFYTARQLPD